MEGIMKICRTLLALALVIGCLAFSQVLALERNLPGSGCDPGALSIGPSEVKMPAQVSPKNNTVFTHYPRNVTLRWRSVSGATLYEVEVDCLDCRQAGKWDSEVGQPWQKASSKVTSHTFTFSGDNQGRWRVRAVKAGRRSDWSPWWTFRFQTGGAAADQAPAPEPAPKTVRTKPVPKTVVTKKLVPKPAVKEAVTIKPAVQTAVAQVATAPQQFLLDFEDAYMVFQPSSNSIQIITEGMVLSYGGEWDKNQLRPYLYHIKQNVWKGFYWQVNTSRKEVYRVRGGEFGQIGGTRQKLDIIVEVVGGSDNTPPDRFLLRFKRASLVYVPASQTMQISAEDNVLSYGTDWDKCQLRPNIYHLKQNVWKGFFWAIDTFKKEALKVTNGEFCQTGGTGRQMIMGVRVIE